MCKQHGLIDRIDGIDIPVPEQAHRVLPETPPRTRREFLNALVRQIAAPRG